MELSPFVKKEIVSPEQYTELMKSSRSVFIKKTRFLPPSFSSSGFGKFEIEYSVPVLQAPHKD